MIRDKVERQRLRAENSTQTQEGVWVLTLGQEKTIKSIKVENRSVFSKSHVGCNVQSRLEETSWRREPTCEAVAAIQGKIAGSSLDSCSDMGMEKRREHYVIH